MPFKSSVSVCNEPDFYYYYCYKYDGKLWLYINIIILSLKQLSNFKSWFDVVTL